MAIPFPLALEPSPGQDFVDVTSLPGGPNNIWVLYLEQVCDIFINPGDQSLWKISSIVKGYTLNILGSGVYTLVGTESGTDFCSVRMWNQTSETWLPERFLLLTVSSVVPIAAPAITSWPLVLRQFLDRGRFNQNQQDTNIRTKVETGPFKVRRRFTQPVTNMSCQVWIPSSSYNDFLNFYNITLQNGTLGFTFEDPILLIDRIWRFTQPFQTSYLGGQEWVITMEWEALPDA